MQDYLRQLRYKFQSRERLWGREESVDNVTRSIVFIGPEVAIRVERLLSGRVAESRLHLRHARAAGGMRRPRPALLSPRHAIPQSAGVSALPAVDTGRLPVMQEPLTGTRPRTSACSADSRVPLPPPPPSGLGHQLGDLLPRHPTLEQSPDQLVAPALHARRSRLRLVYVMRAAARRWWTCMARRYDRGGKSTITADVRSLARPSAVRRRHRGRRVSSGTTSAIGRASSTALYG